MASARAPIAQTEWVGWRLLHVPGRVRVDNLLIDSAGVFDSRTNRFRRDFIEEHAKNFGFAAIQNFFQMLANGFAFTIRISREKYATRSFRSSAEFLDDFFFAGDDVVHRFEVMLDVDPELAFGQVLDVAERRFDYVVVAQVFVDRVRFCR